MSVSPVESGSPSDCVRWIAAARLGDSAALGWLLEVCRPYLLLVANRELPDDLKAKMGPSDLVQNTFVKAHQKFEVFDGHTKDQMLAWLRAILLHELASASRHYRGTGMRQVSREVPLADAPLASLRNRLIVEGDTPSTQAMDRERDEALALALVHLSETARQVVQWRSLERLAFEEIGRRLDRSAAAARQLWVRAIEQLQASLEPTDESR